MIQVILEKDFVNFYNNDKSSPIYSIEKDLLPETRYENGKKISEWVAQITAATWIDGEVPYKLAQIIQKSFPNNDINWHETFFPVEKKNYLKWVSEIKSEFENCEPLSYTNQLKLSIYSGVTENNDDINEKITEIVLKYLSNFGLK